MKWLTGVVVFFCSLAVISNAHAVIKECNSVTQVLPLIDSSKKQLFIFDIDNTIYHPKQMLGSDEWFTYYLKKRQKVSKTFQEALTYVIDLWNSLQVVTEVIPMEPQTKAVIEALQKRGLCVMAMTTRGQELARTTMRQMSSLGIDIEKTAPTNVMFQLQSMPEVLFSKGVLYTFGKHKGEVIKGFLHQLNWKPDEICYINDKREPLDEVEASLLPPMKHIGLRYAVADAYITRFSPIVADKELECFERLLSDDIAQIKL